MVDATVINGKEYPVGNETDPLKMLYRLMLREESGGPVVLDCFNTITGAMRTLGFDEGFDAGRLEANITEYWIEMLNTDTGKYEEVDLEPLGS